MVQKTNYDVEFDIDFLKYNIINVTFLQICFGISNACSSFIMLSLFTPFVAYNLLATLSQL